MSVGEESEWKILEIAMKIEREGEAFYKEAAAHTQDPKGKAMFESLAKDEVIHFETLQSIYRSLHAQRGWPSLESVERNLDKVRVPHPIFPQVDVLAQKGDIHELEALEKAIQAEKESIALYTRGAQEAKGNRTAQMLYDHLVEQEKAHLTILQGELDYLRGTGFWFDIFEVDLEA